MISLMPVPAPGTPPPEPSEAELAAIVVSRLKQFGRAEIVFDACPVADDGWFPEDDFLGTIMCGAVYSVWYEKNEGAWHARGPNEEQAQTVASEPSVPDHHSTSPGTPPSEGKFKIWGVSFSFSEDGVVSLDGGPVVGRLQKLRRPPPVEPVFIPRSKRGRPSS